MFLDDKGQGLDIYTLDRSGGESRRCACPHSSADAAPRLPDTLQRKRFAGISHFQGIMTPDVTLFRCDLIDLYRVREEELIYVLHKLRDSTVARLPLGHPLRVTI
jgi:hypothetical protein